MRNRTIVIFKSGALQPFDFPAEADARSFVSALTNATSDKQLFVVGGNIAIIQTTEIAAVVIDGLVRD